MKKRRLNQSANTLDIRDILNVIWKRKWIIIIPLVLTTAGAIGTSYTLTPKYESSTIVRVEDQVSLPGGLQLGGQGNNARQPRFNDRDRIKSINNEITSIQYIRMLNDRLSLGETAEIQKQARANMVLQPILTLEQAVINVLQMNIKANIQVMWAAGDQIEIIVQSTDPVRARDIADNLGNIYIKEKLKQELSQIRSSQNFSDIQLEKYESQLAEKIRERSNLEQELLTVRLDEEIMSESNGEEIDSEIDRARQQIKDLRSEEKRAEKELEDNKPFSENQLTLVRSVELVSLEKDLKERLGSIGDLMVKYRWSDPQIINFKVRLNDIQTAIERENRRLVDQQFATHDESTRLLLTKLFDIQASLNYLYIKKPYLESSIDEIRTKSNLIPEYVARLSELEHGIDAKTDMRDRFRRQQQISDISQDFVRDVSSSRYRVVEPAKLALGPVYPDRRNIAVMGLLLGLVIGGAVLVLVELFDNSFRSVDDAEEYLDIPVLGVVPGIEILKKV